MKAACIYLLTLAIVLGMSSCGNRQYAFVQPTKPGHYYSPPPVVAVPSAGALPGVVIATPSIEQPELTASANDNLPAVAPITPSAPANAEKQLVSSHLRVMSSELKPVLSRRETRQQLRTYANEVRNARRPADGSGGTNGLAIAALICGIVSLLVLPILFGPLAIIFGAIGMAQTKQRGERGYGMAVAGLVIGIIATVIVLIVLAR